MEELIKVSKERKDYISLMNATLTIANFKEINDYVPFNSYFYHIILAYNPIFLDEKYVEVYPLVDMIIVKYFAEQLHYYASDYLLSMFDEVFDNYDMDLILTNEEMKPFIRKIINDEHDKNFEMEMKFKYLIK